MRKKIALLVIMLIALITLLITGIAIIRGPKPQKPAKLTTIKAESKPTEVPATKPVTSDHVVIDKIGINAKIIPVGLTKEGNMDVPSSIYDVGWYTKGAMPGAKGTAVFAGHVDNASGDPGVFANLNKLAVGDTIKVIKPGGKETSFRVVKTKVYGASDKPSEVFSSKSGAHLNLITCMGNWDKNKSQYDKRLVVFTDLIN